MSSQKNARLIAEATTAGLAFGSVLFWASTCLVSPFPPQDLSDPYWDGIPSLCTDTSGFGAFIVAAISLAISEICASGGVSTPVIGLRRHPMQLVAQRH